MMKVKRSIFACAVLASALFAGGCDDGLDHSECRIIGYKSETILIPIGKTLMPFEQETPVWEHHCKPRNNNNLNKEGNAR